jgi:PadR family transcriptional regulator, regulatory protein PadR
MGIDTGSLEIYPSSLGNAQAPADAHMKSTDRLFGSLDLLILKTLAAGPNHGFGITLHVETVSKGLLHMEEGSLYPALHRLERERLISGEWRQTDNGRRARIYTLTAAGRKRLAENEASWSSVALGIERVLRFV